MSLYDTCAIIEMLGEGVTATLPISNNFESVLAECEVPHNQVSSKDLECLVLLDSCNSRAALLHLCYVVDSSSSSTTLRTLIRSDLSEKAVIKAVAGKEIAAKSNLITAFLDSKTKIVREICSRNVLWDDFSSTEVIAK